MKEIENSRHFERLHFSHLVEQRMDLLQHRADLMAQLTRIDHQLIGVNAEIARLEEKNYVSRMGDTR